MPRQHGITTETVKNLIIDAGAVYVNYGETNERLLGATRDGNSFVVEQEIREMPLDGAKGPVKGARRITSVVPRLTANLIEMSAQALQDALVGSNVADYPDSVGKTHDQITRSLQIDDTDYLTNVALVGEVHGKGEPVICMIKNGLADGNLEISTAENDEAGVSVQFTGHFDPADLDTEPWEIRYPSA